MGNILTILAMGLAVEVTYGQNQAQSQTDSLPFSFNVPPNSNSQFVTSPTSPNPFMNPMMLMMMNMLTDDDSGGEALLPMLMMMDDQGGGAGFPGGNMMFQMMMLMMATKGQKSNCEHGTEDAEKCLEDFTDVMTDCQTNAENERYRKDKDKDFAKEMTVKFIMKRAEEDDCGKFICKAI